MANQEENLRNLIGIQPGQLTEFFPTRNIYNNGTLVTKSNNVTNGLQTIHAVTSGKTFQWVSWSIQCWFIGAGYVQMAVSDDTYTYQYDVFYFDGVADQYLSETLSFPTPIELAASWEVYLKSENANATIYGFIHGSEY